MKTDHLKPFLRGIVDAVIEETERAKSVLSLDELKRQMGDLPETRNFAQALSGRFGLIAEIKKKSPSMGEMDPANVQKAPLAYEKSRIVNAISVLTNSTHFEMQIGDLQRVKDATSKPVLRKEFIVDEYEIYRARKFGADAILLMVNVINDQQRLWDLGALAKSLGMQVLYESHTPEEINMVPKDALVWGINCRKLDSSTPLFRYEASKGLGKVVSLFGGKMKDLSIRDKSLSLVGKIPPHAAVKVAESGVTPAKISSIMKLGYDACLVGNCLLAQKNGGIESVLKEFEDAIYEAGSEAVHRPIGRAVASA